MKMDAWKSISISIHTLHTEGDTLTIHYMDDTDISIHTLHTEGDCIFRCGVFRFSNFNPHPPHGG